MKGMSQRELARRIGISAAAVNEWKQKGTTPSVAMIPEICKVLDVSFDQIYGAKELDFQEYTDGTEVTVTWNQSAEADFQLYRRIKAYMDRGLSDSGYKTKVASGQQSLGRVISAGKQDFLSYIKDKNCIVDKTWFIHDWWKQGAVYSLITRPRRFGKTMTLSMVETFLSAKYENQRDIFCGFEIYDDQEMMDLQGKSIVLRISFGAAKGKSAEKIINKAVEAVCHSLQEWERYVDDEEYSEYCNCYRHMNFKENNATNYRYASILSECTRIMKRKYTGRNIILLIDEYDTPLLEVMPKDEYEIVLEFMSDFYSESTKYNPSVDRVLMMGITDFPKESFFSGTNCVITYSLHDSKFGGYFGFNYSEVKQLLKEYGLEKNFERVCDWYDGFIIGEVEHIFNPWSVMCFLMNEGRFENYWVNTSNNAIIKNILVNCSNEIREKLETLYKGGTTCVSIKNTFTINDVYIKDSAIWGMLYAAGYIKVVSKDKAGGKREIQLTNFEVSEMFTEMFMDFINENGSEGEEFVDGLLRGDTVAVNEYLNDLMMYTISYYDTNQGHFAENFYHGLVLGLLASTRDEYQLLSNRESGRGRYDIMLIPRQQEAKAIIIEFKVQKESEEPTLRHTVEAALNQIQEKNYEAEIISRGFEPSQILKYGIAFTKKEALVGVL